MRVPSSCVYAIECPHLHEHSESTLVAVVDEDVRSIVIVVGVVLPCVLGRAAKSQKGPEGVGDSVRAPLEMIVLLLLPTPPPPPPPMLVRDSDALDRESSMVSDILCAGSMGAIGGMGKLITGGDCTCRKNVEK